MLVDEKEGVHKNEGTINEASLLYYLASQFPIKFPILNDKTSILTHDTSKAIFFTVKEFEVFEIKFK